MLPLGNSRIMRIIGGRPRTYAAFATMVATYFGLPWNMAPSTRYLCAWNAGASLWLVLAFVMMARSNIADMRRRAAKEDDGALIILVVCSAAAISSLIAIAFELNALKAVGEGARTQHMALSAFTVFSSWLYVQTTFTIHYAHEYYDGDRVRGMAFPNPHAGPDYWDFMYFAVNIGAASQTSDVQITSGAVRRLVLAHSVLSFFFNTTILALAINVAAGIL